MQCEPRALGPQARAVRLAARAPFVVNAGTCSSQRLRGRTKACYNIVRLDGDAVEVVRKYPFHGTETLISFVPSTASFEKYICSVPQEEGR